MKNQIKELGILRRKGNGNVCNWKEEQELRRALESVGVLTDIHEFSKAKGTQGHNDEILMHARLMEPVIDTLDKHQDVLYCSLKTPCDQESEICTDGKADKEDKVRSQAGVIGVTSTYFLAAAQFICLTVFEV